MSSCQALDVVVTVDFDVFGVLLFELLDSSDDVLDSALGSHFFRRYIGVGSGSVPVSIKRLSGEGDYNSQFLSDPDEQETSEPHLITRIDTSRWSDLELPLGRHHFCVDTRDRDSTIETCFVVGLDQVTSQNLAGSDTTIVWSLRSWETASWPAVRSTLLIHEGILLLDSEPSLVNGVLFRQLCSLMSVIELVRSAIVLPAFCHDDDVVAASERVFPELDWTEEHIRVVTLGLPGG